MKKYILYSHGGSGNHGCEALVRSTVALINADKTDIQLISYRPDEDYKYGIDKLSNISKRGTLEPLNHFTFSFFKAYLRLKLLKDYEYIDSLCELKGANAKKNDIALAIGGDSYCYGENLNNQLIHDHCLWRRGKIKTVFWGCSIEPELLDDPKIADDMKKFDLITARESISYNALKKVNPNTILVSDSAFLLKKKELPLPDQFKNSDLVGINLSPMAENCERIPGITRENYCALIEKILDETDMKIMLIPHVVWETNDDRTVLSDLYNKYKASDRIFLVEDHNCEELKGYISRCRFFVGARTHATIAAYSSCVPTLVLGYSVKSKGIAKDLFGSYEHYVLPVQNLKKSSDLTDEFTWIMNHENEIKQRLTEFIPEYSNRVYSGLEAMKKL